MAIKYKKISPCMWNDEKFMSMTNSGKLAFIYMLTHPSQTAIGAIRTTVIGLSSELKGLEKKDFAEAFRLGMALESNEAPLVWFPNFTKYNLPESPNVVKAWGKSFLDLPHCVLKKIIYSNTLDILNTMSEPFKKAFVEALGKAFPEDYGYTEAVAVANFIQQYRGSVFSFSGFRECDSVVDPETGEVIYDD